MTIDLDTPVFYGYEICMSLEAVFEVYFGYELRDAAIEDPESFLRNADEHFKDRKVHCAVQASPPQIDPKALVADLIDDVGISFDDGPAEYEFSEQGLIHIAALNEELAEAFKGTYEQGDAISAQQLAELFIKWVDE